MALNPEIANILASAGIGGAGATPPAPGVTPPAPGTPSMGAVSANPAGPTNPVGTQAAAQQALFGARQNDVNYTSQYYDAQAGLIPYSRAELDAREQYNSARGAYLNEQMRASAAEKVDVEAVTKAKGDVGDIQATAMAQRERDTVAYRYNLAGLPTPIEINMPPGFTGPLPAGVVARLRTIAEILDEKAKDNAAMRKYNLEAARIASEIKGVAVSAAEIASGRVRLGIDEVELAMRRAGLDVQQATLNLDRTQEGPPGKVLDAEGNEWVTPEELRLRQMQRTRAATDTLNKDEQGNTDLAPFAIDTMISYAAAGVLGPDWESKVRAELARRAPKEGYTPGFIDIVVAAIKARATESDGGDEGPAIGALPRPSVPGVNGNPPKTYAPNPYPNTIQEF